MGAVVPFAIIRHCGRQAVPLCGHSRGGSSGLRLLPHAEPNASPLTPRSPILEPVGVVWGLVVEVCALCPFEKLAGMTCVPVSALRQYWALSLHVSLGGPTSEFSHPLVMSGEFSLLTFLLEVPSKLEVSVERGMSRLVKKESRGM